MGADECDKGFGITRLASWDVQHLDRRSLEEIGPLPFDFSSCIPHYIPLDHPDFDKI